MPVASRPIVEAALQSWYAKAPMLEVDDGALETLRAFLIGEIRAGYKQALSD